MALPPSTANWHWKTKHVTPWARQWFEQELTALTVKRESGEGEEVVKVDKVTDVEGDVELGQRKSKLITIYDCRVVLKWSGTASDGTDVSGSLSIPEVSHENTVDGLSDYVFDWSLDTSSSGPVDALYNLARTRLPIIIKEKLAEFPNALIDTHGKDLTVSGEPSRSSTPHVAGQGASSSASEPTTTNQKMNKPVPAPKAKAINTETVVVSASFQASADDLFSILTDEKRIPHWSRAPAQSKAVVGTEYSLFGGGVTGSYTSLTPGKEIVQSWRLNSPTWPSGHVGTLTTTLNQSTDSTKLVLSLEGVPKGLEDETRRNLEGVGGLKSIGYVQLVHAPYSPPSSSTSHSLHTSHSRKHYADNTRTSTSTRILSVLIATLVIGAAIAVPWMARR